MKIWVDADACPAVIKDILFRAAVRAEIMLTLVSNHALTVPPSPFITRLQVGSGFDVADSRILQLIQSDDLVITGDIPLAAAVIDKGALALNPRGNLYTKENIKERLAVRNFSTEMRSAGMMTGGPNAMSKKQIQDFANELDKIITRSRKG